MTDREKYIAELASYLSPLDSDERADALEFYDEYITEANLGTREEIEARLGSPRQLGYKILADYSIRTNNEETAKSGRPASPKSNWKVFWWVLIAIITSPVTFTIGIAAIGILIGLIGASLGILVGALAIVIAVVVVACALVYAGIILLFSEPLTGLFYLGLGLAFAGAFMICLPLLIWFIRLLGQGIANFAKYLYSKLQVRREK